MDSSETETCHICQAEFSEETTPGEFCYSCIRCEKHVCTACSENDPRDSYRVICDECWNESDDDEENRCPDCEKVMKPKKSWGGELACYCLWDGKKPSVKQLEAMADDHGLYERKRAIVRDRLGLSLSNS